MGPESSVISPKESMSLMITSASYWSRAAVKAVMLVSASRSSSLKAATAFSAASIMAPLSSVTSPMALIRSSASVVAWDLPQAVSESANSNISRAIMGVCFFISVSPFSVVNSNTLFVRSSFPLQK